MSAGRGHRFADALAEGLERRGMSLAALRDALAARGTPMSLAALSYWRSGLRQPQQEQSMRAVVVIEEILGMLPGELESLTSPGRRRLPRSDLFAVYPDRQDVILRLLRELGMSHPYEELVEREVTTKYDLDARGCAVRFTNIAVLEAVVPGARRLALVMVGETPDERPLEFTSLGGYRVGQVVRDRESMVTIAEMLLEEELQVGETAIVEQQVELDAAEDDNELRYWAWPRVGSVSLWVRYHPDKVPVRCESFTIVNGTEESHEVPIHGTSVHRTVAKFGPGTVGLRWFWGD
ncbi:hypothetical protein MLP_42540 [Microlunatus phosphovorus NM-1]|uniref:Uncharacterized protein n=1 Tax=Microlunatus phosphovorus (strain ATCC 700054 / DSM 10555 / JCM 9379 / NBRC 101784 / NCIMB 13414 / VKM Ac-1990 / NM-1) TaxID=1032480 RepID=F5XSL0_MICPN|nr:hypothetical protein [Microlunatus phosphovorus]BAK37268.1 hypothetical protein MLP_42540 [Microlunatus phosphovorus NM-1]